MIDWEKYNRSQAAISGLGFVEVDIKDYEEMRAAIGQLAEARANASHLIASISIELRSCEDRLTIATEQRDRLVAAIEKHKRTMTMRPDFVDEELWALLD